MASSTWPRGSSDRRQLLAVAAMVLGPPAVWFAMLQTGYALSYPACTGDSHAWLHGITLASAAVLAAIAAGAWQRWRAWRDSSPRDRFLAGLAVIMPVGFLLLAIGSWIPVLILQPCD
jgi:hypothetical protein